MIASKIIADRLEELKIQEQKATILKQADGTSQTNRLTKQQKNAQNQLREEHKNRQIQEDLIRKSRIRTGVLGFVDRFTGRRKRTIEDNLIESTAMDERDCLEVDILKNMHDQEIQHHLSEVETVQKLHNQNIQELDADITWLAPPSEIYERDFDEDERQRRNKYHHRYRDDPRP